MKNLKLFNKWTVLLLALVFTLACKKDDEPSVGEPPSADAGTDADAFVGSTVSLNGSNSSDPEGGTLTFSWELTSAPTGSDASINSASSERATFIPDVAGDYTATLTVEDPDENTDTDDVIISVTENQNEAPEAIIRDAENDAISPDNNNNVVNVGNVFQLSGANSTDPENDALSYLWEVTAAPSGSAPILENAETSTLDFTADVPGEFTIALTVDDGNGNQNTTDVTIEAEVSPVIINSNITEDTTWEDIYEDPSLPDYRVTNAISVNSEVTLTIEPGVVIEFESDRGLQVNGALISDGSESSKIVFTGTTKEKGFWKGIAIYSPNINNLLNHTIVEYAGSSEFGFGVPKVNVGVENGDKLKVTNSTFSNGAGYGLFFENGSDIEDFSGNTFSDNDGFPLGLPINNVGELDIASTFSDNGDNEVAVFGSTLNQTNEIEWKNFEDNTSFRALGNLTVNSGLLISEGTTISFASDVGLEVSGDGYLIAKGTETEKITFTGVIEEAGFWKGIVIYNNNINNELDHTIVSYGGSTAFGFGIPKVNVGIENGDRLAITNSEIFGSAEYGVYVELGGELLDFANNDLHDNGSYPIALSTFNAAKIDAASVFNVGNGDNVVNILGNTLNEGATELSLVELSNGTSYYLTDNLDINSGLVLQDGVKIEVAIDKLIEVSNDGYLIADGTASKGISITGKTKSPGAWKGIAIYTNDVRNLLNYVTVSHGGSTEQGFGIPKVNIGVENGDRLTVTNCTITDCDGIGLFGEAGSTVTQSDNTFSNNVTDIEIN
ncbi:hypothetical protein SAMN05661096_03732 [Marivirga sericea]|uniref:PKD/Chitinase domain-containing protein n=1 Tax=Marivirga sericea TaxID=1028 RepID=A0A1X7LAH6_9BACT|nr:right-handed parallel beta-helix repeat-containing protein [Marivirga sericea]SMG50765.1 hypothetical protein SAMN05661096_03732 [Marivirga sericea]